MCGSDGIWFKFRAADKDEIRRSEGREHIPFSSRG